MSGMVYKANSLFFDDLHSSQMSLNCNNDIVKRIKESIR